MTKLFCVFSGLHFMYKRIKLDYVSQYLLDWVYYLYNNNMLASYMSINT